MHISHKLGNGQTHKRATIWQTQVIVHIWRFSALNWVTRNNNLHGVTREEQENVLYHLAKQETQDLYLKQHLVIPRDWNLFYSTVEEHCQHEPTSQRLRQWLFTWKPVILQSIFDCSNLRLQDNHTITEYFTPSQQF